MNWVKGIGKVNPLILGACCAAGPSGSRIEEQPESAPERMLAQEPSVLLSLGSMGADDPTDGQCRLYFLYSLG